MNFLNLNGFNSFISKLTFPLILEYLRNGLIFFSFAIVAATIFMAYEAFKVRPRFKANPSVKPVMTIKKIELLEKWEAIMDKFNDGKTDNLKIAVIQGDAMIDSILKGAGLRGDHMADRLDNIEPGELASFEDLWRSHKIRNEIAHNASFVLTKEIAERAIRGYEKFLKEMRVISSQ
ncbi:MAG: hypothetical protein Q7S36_03450 [Candidatus Liptonbacteria bacterium]|nr:hypothetical protein [Candidatus Liptonbacteria bacterium]